MERRGERERERERERLKIKRWKQFEIKNTNMYMGTLDSLVFSHISNAKCRRKICLYLKHNTIMKYRD